MPLHFYKIAGKIVSSDQLPLRGLRVEAWDKDRLCDDRVGAGVTDARGIFSIRFEASSFREKFWDRRPDLYFKIYRGAKLVASTEDSVLWNVRRHHAAVKIVLDLPAAPGGKAQGKERSVSGRVSRRDGAPLAGAAVAAFAKDVKGEKLLGRGKTDKQGLYEVRWTSKDAEARLDLVVRVESAKGKDLAVSPTVFNAGDAEVVDLMAAVGDATPASEYERVAARLEPFLKGLAPAKLTAEQAAYLEGASGLPQALVERYLLAARLSAETYLEAVLLYGAFPKDVPPSLDAVLTQKEAVLRALLKESRETNLVPVLHKKDVDAFIAAVHALAAKKALQDPGTRGPASAGQLLQAVPSLKPGQAQELLVLYAQNKGTVEQFWADLRKNPAFKGAVDDVQFSLQAGVVTGNHLPLVDALLALRKAGKIAGWKDLSGWDAAEWKAFLTHRNGRAPAGAPDDAPGATPAEKLANYASGLSARLQDAFPTAAIAARLAKSDAPEKAHLGTFFAKNPDFALERLPLDAYLAKTPSALDGVPEKEVPAVKKELRSLQRLSRVTARYDEIAALKEGGVTSARAAARMGKDAFVAKFGKQLGQERAADIYDTADARAAAATSFVTLYHPDLNVSMTVLETPTSSDMKKELPDWETLFGSQDYCACEDCRSVLSPAAYFTDILHFLMDRAAVPAHKSAKDVLFQRRPDLGEIELSCENTNTPVPYVDLACEILEEAVSPATAVPARQRQTAASAAELAANPEHPNPGAYDVLRGALFPWTLPFDLWTEETRAYLAHLGVDRAELMRALAPKGDPAPEAAAGESLGLTQAERQIITGTHADSGNPWKFWGFTSAAGWPAQAEIVRTLLDRSGLVYEGLDELLQSRFVNPGGAVTIVSTDPSDPLTCDTTKLTLSGGTNTADFLDRLHRFVRLQRRLGWTARQLDAAVSALRPGGLTADFLCALAGVQALSARFGLKTEEVLAWYAPVDTTADEDGQPKCLYERLFQNPAVVKRPAGEADPFALNAGRTDLQAAASLTDAGLRSAVAAALGLSDADLALLVDGASAVVTANKALSLENLSRLFRAASFSRAVGLPVQDFLTARSLIAENPFVNDGQAAPAARVRDTATFADKADKVRAAGSSFPDLAYLLTQQGTASYAPDPAALAAALSDVRDAIRKTAVVAANPDPNGHPIAAEAAALTDDARAEAVAQKLTGVLAANIAVARYFLSDWADDPANAAHRVRKDFLLADFWSLDDAPTAARYPALFRALTKMTKAVALASSLGLSSDELIWTGKNAPRLDWLTFAALPGTAGDAAASLDAWIHLTDFYGWSKDLSVKPGTSVSAVLDGVLSFAGTADAAKKNFIALLTAALGWTGADLTTLLGDATAAPAVPSALNLTFPGDYETTATWLQLGRIFPLLKRLGATATQALAWAAEAPAQDAARAAKQSAKSKHDEDEWLAVAKPLRDPLREKQRAALVDYLVARPDASKGWTWSDADGLYEHFLIDVQMCPCMMTSRIKQASAAVQLFVQRCLMNLEADVKADGSADSAWLQWEWMKIYRVWEANREVFLWPENWIEPDLRDDKSVFFRELEQDLLQNDITQDTAEAALLSYAEKLDEVSRLEIRGVFHETENGRDVLHVFGRTPGHPYKWFYRHRDDGWKWSAWELMNLDVETGQLLPVIWDRRLRVFWPIFTEESDPSADLTMPGEGGTVEKPRKIWKIQLGWSERANGKWSPKHLTVNAMPVPYSLSKGMQKEWFELFSWTAGSQLIIDVRVTDNNLTIGTTFGVTPKQNTLLVGQITFMAGVAEPTMTPMGFNNYSFDPFSTALVPTVGYWPLIPSSSQTREGRALRFGATTFYGFSLLKSETMDGLQRVYVPVLMDTPGTFAVSYPHQFPDFDLNHPFFYQDDGGTFLVTTQLKYLAGVPPADTIPPTQSTGVVNIGGSSSSAPSGPTTGSGSHGPSTVGGSSSTDSGGGSHGPSVVSGPSSGVTVLGGGTSHGPATVGDASGGGGGGTQTAVYAVISIGTQPNTGQGSGATSTYVPADKPYYFENFWHPLAGELARRLRAGGVDGLMDRYLQLTIREFFKNTYHPEQVQPPAVSDPYPRQELEYAPESAYSLYNWELFFHAPLLIAEQLSRNQKFEEAQKWFHYIFNPTDASTFDAPQKYWMTRKFYETTQADYVKQEIRKLLQDLADGTGDTALQLEIEQWRENPFKPHAVALLRTTAYQKTVVMKYIDNLLAWGDSLFRQNTMETINQASQLYVMASEILGRRPDLLKPRAEPAPQTFNSLQAKLRDDDFSDPSVAVESYVPSNFHFIRKSRNFGGATVNGGVVVNGGGKYEGLGGAGTRLRLPEVLFYCVPRNEKLLGYWDLVADRLYKIRHCMDIEGRVQQLPLFDPPIDPGMLVKAAAAGVDLSDALADLAAPLAPYRFQTMAQKATELCSEVKALGSALLAALEKKDAEDLALLRSAQEIKVLNAARLVKQRQIDEANEALEGLNRQLELVTLRRNYYRDVLFMNPFEIVSMAINTVALTIPPAEIGASILAGALHLIPNIKIGAPPSIGATYGGENVAPAAQAFGSAMATTVGMMNAMAAMSGTLATYTRRWDDWKLQESLAGKELEQIGRQINAAKVRLEIAQKELDNHDLQVQNAQDLSDFMHDKYTNRDLYNWMTGQVSTVYFQTYKLAMDLAKKAERSYRFELGLDDSDFVQTAYWDSLKKGLMAGDALHHDLKRMEADYLDRNVREYELTKTVSLALTDPAALVALKRAGDCFFTLDEALFDMDHPGHYFRRIKSVAVSIPCVAGPYQGVHATLTLSSSSLRKNPSLKNNKYERDPAGDGRFRDDLQPVTDSIATSTGREDAGLFEANLRDERYLPFEGAGAADSVWRLVLDKDANRFDFGGISDVVLHVRYTAREGGDALAGPAKARLKTLETTAADTPLLRLFSLKSEFSDGWYRFMNPGDADAAQSLTLDLTDRLPDGTTVAGMGFYLKVKDDALPAAPDDVILHLYAGTSAAGADLLANNPLQYKPLAASNAAARSLHQAAASFNPARAPGAFLLSATGSEVPNFLKKVVTVAGTDYKHLDPDKVEDVFVLLTLLKS